MTSDQSLWYLENIDLSGILCPRKIQRGDLDTHEQKVFEKGSYIYLPDEYADRMFFITEGRVKIGTYSDQGKEVTKAIIRPGEVFGELSMIGENRRHDFAYAMEQTHTCVMTVGDLEDMMREHSGPVPLPDAHHGLPNAGNGEPPAIARFQRFQNPHN